MSTEKKQTLMEAIGMAFLTWKRHAQKEIQPYGVTLKQFSVLRELNKRGVLYPAEIAEMLFCDRPTAAVVIRNMEKKGWIRRESDLNDRRRFNVFLEPAGKKKLSDVPWEQAEYRKKQFKPASCFTEKELTQFRDLLGKLNRHLSRIGDGT
ncbi:MAG: MarR family transcriptional regulator [Deltaproteobacteria bacterium]|nr:MarR family transcriptional regulator [Deltaproteobacteria bacterium]